MLPNCQCRFTSRGWVLSNAQLLTVPPCNFDFTTSHKRTQTHTNAHERTQTHTNAHQRTPTYTKRTQTHPGRFTKELDNSCKKYHTHIQGDVKDWAIMAKELGLLKNGRVPVAVWASPDCATFSTQAAQHVHGRTFETPYGTSAKSAEASKVTAAVAINGLHDRLLAPSAVSPHLVASAAHPRSLFV